MLRKNYNYLPNIDTFIYIKNILSGPEFDNLTKSQQLAQINEMSGYNFTLNYFDDLDKINPNPNIKLDSDLNSDSDLDSNSNLDLERHNQMIELEKMEEILNEELKKIMLNLNNQNIQNSIKCPTIIFETNNTLNDLYVQIENLKQCSTLNILQKKLLELLELSCLIFNMKNESEMGCIRRMIEIVKNNDVEILVERIEYTKIRIFNNLIKNILLNSPKSNITTREFVNIKTELYPYQVNNLNWMINIENKIYSEEYNEIKSQCVFRGGGLFDEVGMGKTLQIITLINHNKNKWTSIIKNKKLYSKATLIIVPNHLCGQWAREFETHTKMRLNIINLLTKRHYNKYNYYDLMNADVVIISSNFFVNCKLNQHEIIDSLNLINNIFDTNVNIYNMYWLRVVIDEFHEMETSKIFVRVKYIESDYRWIISGTPFKENEIDELNQIQNTSLSEIVDYLTWDLNQLNRIEITDIKNYDYIKNHFSRNTHIANVKILKLPDVVEETIWLKFTDTERMIYNAYLADTNNNPHDIFLRQICCHPMIAEKLRENMANSVESLSDIQEQISKMYLTDFNKADTIYTNCLDRIDRISSEIDAMIKEKKTELVGFANLKDELADAQNKLINYKKIRDGKEKTIVYYKKFIELLSSMDNITSQECPICMDNIKEEDLGITFCGHIYCYTCISTIIKEAKTSGILSKCPNCSTSLQLDKIFLINKKKTNEINNLGTKLSWIIDYIKQTPNKYRIIFSQWDYLLKEVGKVLNANGIKNLYCQGHVYQKDRVLRLFNSKDESNEFKIIMLSSESTVSGSNLNNAEEVIFLDPVYGDKQHRINTEKQAIGRVIRLGNLHKIIKVIRILIKDSIEEEIYKSNQN